MKILALRTRFVAVVLAGAILPLAIVGAWLGRSSVSTTSDALRAQLQTELEQVRVEMERRWEYRIGDILLLAENEETLAFLRRGEAPDAATIAYLDSIWRPNQQALPTIEYRSPNGDLLWRLDVPQTEPGDSRQRAGVAPTIAVPIEVRDPRTKKKIGDVLAQVRASSLSQDSIPLSLPGARLLVRHRPTGAALVVSTELPVEALQANRFVADGEDWIAARVMGEDPPIDLTAAAPITPLIAPYRRAARIGAVALVITALLVSFLIFFLTSRMTRGLHQLSVAAEALAAGDLNARVPRNGQDEVGRVGDVFNRMADSLDRTLSELAQQRALAAIGEFAASLSHEVRNALTSVRIDLERAAQSQTDAETRRVLAERALANATRLEHIVTGLLRIARSGQTTLTSIDLLDPLRTAVSAVLVQSPNGGITVDDKAATHTMIAGDQAALEQLFTNLILNAVEASDAAPVNETDKSVRIVVRNDGESVVVDISDRGSGIAPERVGRAFQAFYTTKPQGTGLGLAIARNIARSMSGDVRITSTGDAGTTMTVALPLAPQP